MSEHTSHSSHTEALRYSFLERLHARLFGVWPARVVKKRLAALDADRRQNEAAIVDAIRDAEQARKQRR